MQLRYLCGARNAGKRIVLSTLIAGAVCSGPSSASPGDAVPFRLMCQIRTSPSSPPFEFVFLVDEGANTVDGRPATISDTQISYSRTTSNSGETLEFFISRVSGTFTMTSSLLGQLGEGRCDRLGAGRKF
jgi:hypothetical protein